MSLYVKITRSDVDGSYIQPISEIANAIDGELDGTHEGESITLTVIEMTDENYNALPEFQGW